MKLTAIHTLIAGISLVQAGCADVSSLPEGWRKFKESHIPSDPIVTESKAETEDSASGEQAGNASSQMPMLALGEQCDVVGANKTVLVTDANASQAIALQESAVIRIATKGKTVTIVTELPLDTLCVASGGSGNSIKLVMKEKVSDLFLMVSGQSESWDVFTDINGWTTDTTLVMDGTANTMKFSGTGNFDCPKTNQVAAGNALNCVE